jgi:hypothetical protein
MEFRVLCIYEIVYFSLFLFRGTFVGIIHSILFSDSILTISWLHATRSAHPARAKGRTL